MTFKKYTELLAELIAIPSASSMELAYDESNEKVIHLLADWCESLGMQVEVLNVAPEHHGKSTAKKNLIATLGQGSGGLVLSGHTDTVPVNDQQWNTDPYKLTKKDDKFFGIGATDMKGFFPVALKAIEAFATDPKKLKSPIILLATADEESGMAGAKALLEAQKPKAAYAIIGEPTDLKPIVSHKGVIMESIRLIGQSGHSSDPSLGTNAIEAMNWVLNQLMQWRDSLKQAHQDPNFNVPFPTLNLGCIHGGDGVNKICEVCELHMDLRFLPQMSANELQTALRQRLKPVEEAVPGIQLEIKPLFSGLPAFKSENENPLAQEFQDTLEKLTQHPSQHVAFGTEAPYLQTLGMAPIILGPGSIDQAHQANEFIRCEQIDPAIEILKQLMVKYCL